MTTTKTKTIRARLVRLGACDEAIKKYGAMTASEAWAACDSPGDLAWIVCRVAGTRGNLTRRQQHGVMSDVLELTLPKAGASRKVVETVVALLRRSAGGGVVSADEWAAAAWAAWAALVAARASRAAAWAAEAAARAEEMAASWAASWAVEAWAASSWAAGKTAVVEAIKRAVECREGKLVMRDEHGQA